MKRQCKTRKEEEICVTFEGDNFRAKLTIFMAQGKIATCDLTEA